MRKILMLIGILSILATSANAATWPNTTTSMFPAHLSHGDVLLYDQSWNSSDEFGYNIYGAFNPF